jgi:signal transduction histidine kinase
LQRRRYSRTVNALPPTPIALDDPQALARDVADIARIQAVAGILEIVCQMTGMGFAAVARVTDGTWTACAVRDLIGFGLQPGGQLGVETTLCSEARAERRTIAFDDASQNPLYRDHHTPRIYNIRSYISVPIVLGNGDYFGNLCAIDPQPRVASSPSVVASFEAFAKLIGGELERTRNDAALESELRTEREVSAMREQFIAVLGHDLRSPLSAVAMMAEGMVRHGERVDVQATGLRIRSSVKRMARLIDDVLDMERGRLSGKVELSASETEVLGQALSVVVDEVRSAHQDRDIRARIEIAGPVRADTTRLQQLLSNLLSNAIHHGAPGVPVSVEVSRQGADLVISVANGGAPISLEAQLSIFQPYWRAKDRSPSDGLGLGLHISTLIARAHGGRIDVDSPPDGLIRFVARLPAAGPA